MPEQAGYFAHPIAAEATHAEADLPNVPPVRRSVAQIMQMGNCRCHRKHTERWRLLIHGFQNPPAGQKSRTDTRTDTGGIGVAGDTARRNSAQSV